MANKSLYVGNLPYSATESQLRQVFDSYGPLGDIRIIGDKGFGFVEVPEENMQAAIDANNGNDFGGRPMVVNEARPRTDRNDRQGGGGGGYGNRGGGDRNGGGYGRRY